MQAVELLSTRSLFDSSKARLVRLDLAATMGRFFGQYDLLVTPTMADVPFGLDRSAPEYGPSLAWTPFTYPVQPDRRARRSRSRPGLAPAGFLSGCSLGPRFSEGRVLRAAAAFEAAQPWAGRRPPTS